MFTRPEEVTDVDVVAALVDGWGRPAPDVEYAAVGYGSHHWHATEGGRRWFVTVDDLDARRRHATESRADVADRLSGALGVARSLQQVGLDFVVAPIPTRGGAVLHPVDERFVVARYPFVEGAVHAWGPYPSGEQRLAVLDRLVAVHHVDPAVAGSARPDDFAIPGRDRLTDALADRDEAWGPGPYAAPARDLLDRHREPLVAVLARYDRLVTQVAARPERGVLTHGEPHRGNTIDTADGVVLIDWDTVLVAPPERDLWALVGEDLQMAAEYARRTGVDVDDVAIELYRLWWDLCEISLFVAELRRPHPGNEDTRVAWDALTRHLDPARWSSGR
jgi:hypothetical protein